MRQRKTEAGQDFPEARVRRGKGTLLELQFWFSSSRFQRMAANLKENPLQALADTLQQEWFVSGQRGGHFLSAVETGLESALDVAKELARRGYRVRVHTVDPDDPDCLAFEVWSDRL